MFTERQSLIDVTHDVTMVTHDVTHDVTMVTHDVTHDVSNIHCNHGNTTL